MSAPVLLSSQDGAILQLTLNRPDAHNALDSALCRDLIAALQAADEDDHQRLDEIGQQHIAETLPAVLFQHLPVAAAAAVVAQRQATNHAAAVPGAQNIGQHRDQNDGNCHDAPSPFSPQIRPAGG